MIDEALKVFRENQGLFAFCATVSGIIFGLIGGWIGHRMSIGRDRRLARIAVKQRIRERPLRAQGNLAIDDDLLIRMLPWWKRDSFRRAADDYKQKQADTTPNEYGEAISSNSNAVAAAIDKLLPYTAER